MARTTRSIDSLKAQEHKAREALAAGQTHVRAAQRCLDQARWQQRGQRAGAAGLGALPVAGAGAAA
jgi:hypothetical protein